MSPVIIAAIAAVVLIGIIVGTDLFRSVMDERLKLTREQRSREDEAREYARRIAGQNRELDIAAGVFDPLGLFH